MTKDPGSGGSSHAVDLEFGSIQTAIGQMNKVAQDIATLKSDFATFTGKVKPADWSQESSCQAFGTSYTSALAVYGQVLSGMHTDLEAYTKALQAAHDSYHDSDASAAAALAKLGQVDDGGLAQNTQGRTSYDDDKHHEVLDSDKPAAATDTTPGDSAVTTLPEQQSGNQPPAATQPAAATQTTTPPQTVTAPQTVTVKPTDFTTPFPFQPGGKNPILAPVTGATQGGDS